MSVIVPGLQILYTNIGRGHPFYLDGIIDALIRKGNIRLVRRQNDVFEISSAIPRLLWRTARWLYVRGSSGGIPGVLYRLARSRADYNGSGLMVRLMGRDVRRHYAASSDPLIVAHPTLVGILRNKPNLIYQHGELVVPREALVSGASLVFAPTEQAASVFRDFGYSTDQVKVTGLCIEPSIVRQAFEAYEIRLDRYGEDGPLTGAFFSSGAEPKSHVEKLIEAAYSAVREGGRVLIFAHNGGELIRKAGWFCKEKGIDHVEIGPTDPIPADLPEAVIVNFNNRREESIFTTKLFPLFDYLVAPPHERSNWAAGLGLPMFALEPCIGPFAPMNRNYLFELGVAETLSTLDDASSLGMRITHHRREGRLEAMSRAGWGKQLINGFETIADFLIREYS